MIRRLHADSQGEPDTGRRSGAIAPARSATIKVPIAITKRSAAFADRVIQLCLVLPSHAVGWEISRQLVRCGMSVGANVEESQAAESKADFVHKLKIARKECREARYFLQRIRGARLVAPNRLGALLDEAEEIISVLTTIILRTQERLDPPSPGSARSTA